MLKPAAVPDTITKLAATTFAQPIERRMLSVMVPLLVRGLRERNTAIRRKTVLIIGNMVKLVEEPAHLAAFMPALLPEVDKLSREISDPEARAVAVATHAQLVKAAGSEDGAAALQQDEARHATPEARTPFSPLTCAQSLAALFDARKAGSERPMAHAHGSQGRMTKRRGGCRQWRRT